MKLKLAIPKQAEGFSFLCRPPLQEMPSHHHDELEFGLVMEGRASYLLGQAQRVDVTPGSMIWLFPNQEHVLIDPSREFAMWTLMFRPALVHQNTSDPSRQPLRALDPKAIFCRQVDPRTSERLANIYRSISESMVAGDYEFCNSSLPHALLASWQAYQASTQPSVRRDVHPAVARAAHLMSDAEEVVPLPELAKKAGLSAHRLSRLFKKQVGVSLAVFRQQKCVERFLRVYRDGSRYSLMEAALTAGFGSYPQFYRVFRRHMHQSPAEYARTARGEG
jgi:AraC-like DNA-binding protein